MTRFSQVFLRNKNALLRIAELAGISRNDVVLEIGAGYGNLTELLCERAGKVYAIEIDRKLVEKLRINIGKFKNAEIISGDALKIDFPKECNKIVANLPYEISGPITEKILDFLNAQKKEGMKDVFAVLMYQREFAEHLVAEPGFPDYSRITLLVRHLGSAEILMSLPPNYFKPEPKVSSSVVKIIPKGAEKDMLFLKVVGILFQHSSSIAIKALVNARHNFKISGKKALREFLEQRIGRLGEKRVFELDEHDIAKIKESLMEIMK